MRKLEHCIYMPIGLVLIFLSYYSGISLFTHTHVVNGVMIAHSHPFAEDTHNHSETQILAFNKAGHFQSAEIAEFETITAEWHELYELSCCRDVFYRVSIHSVGVNLRAPPCC